jgi:mannose-6-phosphate isomerase-like protein (cupin superfamily)
MKIFIHDDQQIETWREGVRTRMRTSLLLGGHQLCIFDQFCDYDRGAPIHIHAVEEILEVISGRAEFMLGDERAVVTSNQSILIPPGVKHSFRNLEHNMLHVRATLAAPVFEASYENSGEISRRWTWQ